MNGKATWAGRIILICFFFSGMSSLIYEAIWLRMLVLIFGSTTLAVSTVLTAFMGGLAIGSLWFGRIIDRRNRPLLTYGILEIGIGGYALLVPILFPLLVPLYQFIWETFHPSFYLFNFFRFLLIMMVLILPTILMGATLPVLATHYTGRPERPEYRIGTLYAINTTGAVAGTFATGFIFLPTFGVHSTTWVAVLMNFILGATVIWLSLQGIFQYGPRPAPVQPEPDPEEVPPIQPSPPPVEPGLKNPLLPQWKIGLVLLVFSISGYTAMVYQVVWTRILSLILGSSIYAFSAMLTTFLIGLALGSLAFTQVLHMIKKPFRIFAFIQIGIGLTCFAGALMFERLPYFFLNAMSWGLPAFYNHPDWLLMGLWFFTTFGIMFIPTALFGGTFPVVIKIYQAKTAKMGRSTGDVYFVNTVGAVAGAFMGGFILIPSLGIQMTMVTTLFLNLLLGGLMILLSPQWSTARRMTALAPVLVMAILLLWVKVPWNPIMMTFNLGIEFPTYLKIIEQTGSDGGWKAFNQKMTENLEIEFYEEGPTATVTVVRDPQGNRVLKNNGRPEGGERYLRTHALLGHLPFLLGETGPQNKNNVLMIGLGTGVTLGSAQRYPLKQIAAVELEPAVLRAAKHFNDQNKVDWEDPRLKVMVNDGRNFLLTNEEFYDVIISQPSLPWLTGVSNLFTKDFFRLGETRLREGGLFAQWISVYSMTEENLKSVIQSFQSVFPNVMIFDPSPPDMILIGSELPLHMNPNVFFQLFEQEIFKSEMVRIDIHNPFDLLSTFALGPQETAAYVQGARENTDDNAYVEVQGPLDYYSGRINGQPQMIREGMLATHASLTRYLSHFQEIPDDAKADFFLKLAQAYFRQNNVHRENALGYSHAYADRSMAIRESAEGHLLMAKILIALYQKTTGEKTGEEKTKPYLKAALTAIETALTYDPLLGEGYLLGGNLYFRLGEAESGINTYKRTIELNAGLPEPHYSLATLLHATGKKDEARKHYETFLRLVSGKESYQDLITRAKKQLEALTAESPPAS